MGQLVGQPLEVIWFEATCVIHYIVVGWSNSSLSDRLANQKEVIPAKNVNTVTWRLSYAFQLAILILGIYHFLNVLGSPFLSRFNCIFMQFF